MTTDHPQVPFTTLYGEKVEVDEGLLEILEVLKRFGVVTLASCQDNLGQGYISALRPGMNQFLKKVFSFRDYSDEANDFVNGFKSGFKVVDISIFVKDGTVRFPLYESSRGVHDPEGYQIEHYFRNDKAPSMVIRWPHEKNETFLNLLIEMYA